MLLRVRVRLPDRPGSLGKVARTLGAAGADVVQMAVLESDAGRALDDFTVAWPAGVGIERLCDGLSLIPGVEIVGIWPTVEPQGAFPDAALIGQLAADTTGAGLLILTDAVPAILSADWAVLARLGGAGEDADDGGVTGEIATILHRSVHVVSRSGAGAGTGTGVGGGVGAGGGAVTRQRTPEGEADADAAGLPLPELRPLRPRAFTGADGTRYAVTPVAGGELALLLARIGAPPFHRTEVFRLAQLVGAAEAVLGARPGAEGGRGVVGVAGSAYL